MPKGVPLDLTGQRFGAWTVLRKNGVTQNFQVLWRCRCDCGKEVDVQTGNLRSGKSTRCRSCGNRRENNSRWTA